MHGPDARDQLDDTMAQIAGQTGAALRTYPRLGAAARWVILRDTRDERGTRLEVAQLGLEGTVRVIGHHSGPGVSDFSGCRDHLLRMDLHHRRRQDPSIAHRPGRQGG